LDGKCLKCHPELDPNRQNRATETPPAPGLHSSLSCKSFASTSSGRSLGSNEEKSSSTHRSSGSEHENQGARPRPGRMPPRRVRSMRPAQGTLQRDMPSRSQSDEGLMTGLRGREPRRAQRPNHRLATRSYSPTPDTDSFHASRVSLPDDGGKDSASTLTASTEIDGSVHALDLLQASSQFSFDSSVGSSRLVLPDTTHEDVKLKIAEKKATKSADLLAECLVKSMKDHHGDISIQMHCLDTIADEALESPSFALTLTRHGANKLLSKALSRHFGDQGMVASAFAALRILTTKSEARNDLVGLSLSKSIVEAMQCNLSSKSIQCDGCAILSNLAFDAPNKKVDAVYQSVIDALVQAMQEHPQDESVVNGACFALRNLTYNEANLRTMGRTEGLTDTLQAALERYDSMFEALETLDSVQISLAEDASLEESILMTLKDNNADNPDAIVNVLDTLKAFSWSKLIVGECLTAVKSLALTSEQHKDKLFSSIALDELRAYAKDFGDDQSIQSNMIAVTNLIFSHGSTSNSMLEDKATPGSTADTAFVADEAAAADL